MRMSSAPKQMSRSLGKKAALSVPSHCLPVSCLAWELKYFQMSKEGGLGSCFPNDSTPLRGNAAWIPELLSVAKIVFICFSTECLHAPRHCTSHTPGLFLWSQVVKAEHPWLRAEHEGRHPYFIRHTGCFSRWRQRLSACADWVDSSHQAHLTRIPGGREAIGVLSVEPLKTL